MTVDQLKTFFNKHREKFLIGICVLLFLFVLLKRPKIVVEKDPLVMSQLKTYKDENGKLHSIIDQKEAEKAEIQSYVDSLAKALGVKPRFIKGQDKFTVQIDTIFREIPVERIIVGEAKDTMYKVEKHDRWLDVVAIAGKDTGSIKFSIRDTLTRVEVVKNPLIGRTSRQVFISAASPYSRIMAGSSFTIKEKQTWLSIGPSVQYDPFGKRMAVGVSIQVPIIKLKR